MDVVICYPSNCSIFPWLQLADFNCHQIIIIWPSDAIWWHGPGSTLAQVMACCLKAPSHYLHQCWLIFKGVLWHSLESNIAISMCSEITLLKLLPHLPGANESTHSYRFFFIQIWWKEHFIIQFSAIFSSQNFAHGMRTLLTTDTFYHNS